MTFMTQKSAVLLLILLFPIPVLTAQAYYFELIEDWVDNDRITFEQLAHMTYLVTEQISVDSGIEDAMLHFSRQSYYDIFADRYQTARLGESALFIYLAVDHPDVVEVLDYFSYAHIARKVVRERLFNGMPQASRVLTAYEAFILIRNIIEDKREQR